MSTRPVPAAGPAPADSTPATAAPLSVISAAPADGPAQGVRLRNTVRIPIRHGVTASFLTFDGFDEPAEHFALRLGQSLPEVPLVRLHSECITGDVFGSQRCDCGPQLNDAIDMMAINGGLLVYPRQEGRGIGLRAKLDAYRLQDEGLDTYAANEALHLPADARDYRCAADMLKALGLTRIRLLSNNPDKRRQLEAHGITVTEQVPTATRLTAHNRDYLAAKVRVTGHTLDL